MGASQSSKAHQQTVKATLKAIDQDYKDKVREAEKKCNAMRKEADKVAERERAESKARKDKADKDAKDEYQLVKHAAAEVHIQLVMDIVKNVILDIKSRQMDQSHGHSILLNRSNSTSSAGSSSSTSKDTLSSLTKEDAEVKEWVEHAAERLEVHMSKTQARQRLLEEIASGALIRQHQAQQDALRKTEELERQLHQLRLQQQQGFRGVATGQDVPPPAYINAVGPAGVDNSDYSVYTNKK
ncbi:hypothetical protein BGZ99_002709 [Dissophora globulifera]|uniref:Uncharacterized protein n=1 Tax=Dissophora globulifera TaxID=979702 RepID=A0A9P6RPA6_9FUNG|nr:hypothetical protein BGZ99_002709 [Dissophora globulifera]